MRLFLLALPQKQPFKCRHTTNKILKFRKIAISTSVVSGPGGSHST